MQIACGVRNADSIPGFKTISQVRQYFNTFPSFLKIDTVSKYVCIFDMTLTKVNKLPVFLAIAASVIFLFAAFRQHGDGTTLPDAANKILEFGRSRPSFYEIAIKTGTDKVTDHSYHHMYQKYLPAIRNRKIKMLEIGLGCDMSYGPGASVSLLAYSSTFSLSPSISNASIPVSDV